MLNAITGTSLAAEIDTTGGEAYVDGFQVKEQHDGIGPFDDNDEAGNDSSDGNLIVRSFDSVSYMLEYTTELIDQSKPATHGASLYTEFTLPTSPDKARFDIDVMNWMLDKKLVYTYSDGTTSETKDKAKTITMQTLTGRRLLANKSNDDRVPGAGQLSVGVTIKNAENGVRIKPSFKIRAAGTAIEKVCEPKSVTVSAAPRYNIEVKDNAYNTSRNIAYVDEDKGTVSIQDTSGSLQHGRIYGRSVAIALWNTSADKGLKGIEFPKGDITYDIKTTATLDGKDSTDNGEYGVSLWDYKENNSSAKGYLGKQMYIFGDDRSHWGAYSSVFNSLKHHSDKVDTAYDGGTITAVADKDDTSTMHVTVSDYQFDIDNFIFPTKYAWYDSSTPKFAANIGYFSVGYFQYFARFPLSTTEGIKNFFVNTQVSNFHAHTQSNVSCTTEMKTNDNAVSDNVVIYSPGDFSKYSYFCLHTSYWNAGDDWASPRTKTTCGTRLGYSGTKPLESADVLFKIDTEALEVRDGSSVTTLFPQQTLFDKSNIQILYAVKPTGKGWESDEEMQSTRQEQLLYFDSYEKLVASKKTCVAILYRMRNVKIYVVRDSPQFNLAYKVKDDAKGGYVAQITADARAWTIPNPGESIIGTNDDGSIGTIMDSSYGNTQWVDGYTKPEYKDYTPYKKRTYNNGTISGGHTNGYHGGDSLLIVTSKNRVNIEVNDIKEDKTKKEIYDLDAGERTVMFKVSPAIDLISENQSTISTGNKGTAQITVTLPVGLTYKSSSIAPTSVKQNNDGTETAIFDYQNVTAGREIDSFTISCTIGYAGTDHDVKNNQQLTATAKITSSLDGKVPTKARGTIADSSIVVVRLAALSVSKFVSPAHGNLGCSHSWTLNFGNSSQTDVDNARIADIMPYVGDGRGTKFTGDYHIKKITLDLSKASRLKASLGSEPIFYTSDVTIRKSSDDAIVNGSKPSSFKSLGAPTVNGDSLIWDNLDMTQDQLKAWRLDIPKMPGNEYISITIDVSTSDADGNLYADSSGKKQQPDDIYANTFAEYADGQAAVVHSNVVNTTVKEADISVTKKWSGDDGHEKFRPDSVIANLSGSNGYSQDLQLSSSNNWTETVKGLAYYDENGDKITYTVSEPTVSDDYVSTVEGDSDNGFTVTNTYTYKATGKIHLTAMKKITGRDFEKGDSMTFKAEESISPAGATATTLNGKEVTVTPTLGNECEIDFGTVDIDSSFEGKTITYTIYEKSATGRGMSKDESKKTISFSITDPNHDHKLRVTKTTESDTPAFTNTFTPNAATGSVTIKKTLTGRAWKSSDSFDMTIEPKTTNSITKEQAKAAMPSITLPSFTKPSSGSTSAVTISGFSFARPGIYEYEIREKIPNDAKNGTKDGIAYDTASFNVSFNVTQDKQTGNLSVTQTMKRSDKKNTDAFTNRYSAAGKFTITGTKTLTGRAMKADEFTFELLDSNGTVLDTANNTADGKFSFKPIEVTADSNVLTYTVREKKGTAGGVTYDEHECTVTATPTDAGDGTVNVKLTYSDGNTAKFSNSYNATGMIRFSTITKKVIGRSFNGGDALTFHLTGEVTDDGTLKAPMPSNVDTNGNITIRPTSGQQADIILGTANIDSKYSGHTIRYTLTETSAEAHGLSIDTSKKTFEFNVTDPTLNGRLLIRENTSDNLTFTDTFTPDPITSSFTIRKQLNGRFWKAGETFDIDITAKESKSISIEESATTLGSKTKTVSIDAPQSNSGTGSVDVPLTISKPGKYIYKAVEKNAGQTKNGITYDSRKITVTINVAQNKETDGKLYVATTTYETDSGEATDTFINGYESKGTLDNIKVTKNLVGRDWKKSDKFKFRISAGDDTTSAAIYATDVTLPSNDTITITSDGKHQSAFDKITFKKGGTYRFDITELAHGISGIDIAPKATITVKAVDDGNGTIRCTVDGTSNVTFTDYYAKNEKVTVPINGKKTLSHDGYEKVPDITGKYAFALKDANGNTIETSTNDSNGNISFSPLSYTIDDFGSETTNDDGTRTKTLHYTISESGNIDGVTNDADKSFNVILADDGNGTLTAKTVHADGGSTFLFTNIFTASATIPTITGTKTLKNAPSSDESTYSFRLSPSDNATSEAINNGTILMPNETTYQQTECKAGEKFEFAPMTVTKPGTYSFDVSEIEPQDETVAPGVTYDKTIYTLRFTVSENGTPTMDVTPDEKNVESCDFNNKYTAKGRFSAKAHKRLNGKQLEDGEFEFELHDGNGNIISTTKNDANGNISFDEIEYGIDDIGQHRYTIVEKNGGKLGITYDSKTIAVDVSVSDNGDGTLRIDASYDEAKDEETFNNSYTPPSASDVLNDLVQTGIETLPYVISITCCIIPTIAIMRRKRK